MPSSDPQARIRAIWYMVVTGVPQRILEIGIGSGYYGNTIKKIWPETYIYGMDIWEPYITDQHRKDYDEIILADMRDYDYSKIEADLVILADVVEHVEKEEAVVLLAKLKEHFKRLLITIPICYVPQGPYMGNIYEEHKHHWSPEEFCEATGAKYIAYCGICGLFEITK